ncbi:unnamed protein product, partial [Tilletia caries]
FTDGSRIEGRVGAAAINEQTRLSSQVHLGSDQHHTVYEAELQGILLALKAAEASNIPLFQVTIAADNQAAIMALGRPPRRQSGQHLVLQIHATIGAIRTQNKWCAFRLIWCPGHEGIAANEEVDGLAKEAAEAAEAVEIGMASTILKPCSLRRAYWQELRTMFRHRERLLRALQQHPKSIQRISALRLLYRTRFSYTNGKYVDADQNACSTGCWTALALLFNEALSQRQTGSALRVLDYQSDVDPTEVDEADRAARLNFWSTLTAHASLHGLRLRFSVGDSVTYLLRHGSFPSLKNVEFSSGSLRGEPQLYLIVDAFLHRHTGLQQLYLILYRPASAPLILDQTFPALHTLELDSITSSTVSSERVLDLLRRHPGLRQTTTLWERDALHSLLSSNAQMYKHLPVPANATPNDLSDLVKSGARPLRARVRLTESPIPARSSNSDDTRFFDLGFKDWYGIRPEHLEDLTYLQVICCNVTFPSLVRRSYQLFASDFLPALTSAPHEGPARRGPPEARTFGLTFSRNGHFYRAQKQCREDRARPESLQAAR